MNQVAVAMGSNLGDRLAYLEAGRAGLLDLAEPGSLRLSAIYETEPTGCSDPGDYLNAVAVFMTRVAPEPLLQALLALEAGQSRKRPYLNAPRTLDLDLLVFGQACVETPFLTLPHPRLTQRLFVLTPLVELWPDWCHPRLGATVMELEQACLAGGVPVLSKSQYAWAVGLSR